MLNRHVASGATIAALLLLAGAYMPPASAKLVTVVEYFSPPLEHYFTTTNADEIRALDAGVVAGWWRTGQRFRVDDAPAADLSPVCRYFTAAYAGKATHFYSALASECDALRANPDWVFEGVAFYARVPEAQGACPEGTAAIRRLYNGGQGGAPNHAYVGAATRAYTQRTLGGWIDEGVAFCSKVGPGDPWAMTWKLARGTWSFPMSPAIDVGDALCVDSPDWAGTCAGFLGIVSANFAPDASLVYYTESFYELFGLSTSAAAIQDQSYDRGIAAWDPLAGAYVVTFFDNPPYGIYAPYATHAWTFDDADVSPTPVCIHTVFGNFVDTASVRHNIYQPWLWSGCAPGIAKRF